MGEKDKQLEETGRVVRSRDRLLKLDQKKRKGSLTLDGRRIDRPRDEAEQSGDKKGKCDD